MLETLREKQCFGDQLDVWCRHSHRSKQLFEVIWQFRSTSVCFTGWVHGHENAGILVNRNSSAKKFKLRLLFLDGPLDHLNLLRNSRELLFKQSIELIEAPPSTAFDQSNEDSTHRFEVKTFIAIEDKHLSSKSLTQSLDGLGLSGTGWPVRISTVAHLHS